MNWKNLVHWIDKLKDDKDEIRAKFWVFTMRIDSLKSPCVMKEENV